MTTPEKLVRSIIRSVISVSFALLCMWIVLKFMTWLETPRWFIIGMGIWFAIDIALITSGIRPSGLMPRRKE